MRDLIVYIVIVLLYKVETRTFCDDSKCVCLNKERSLEVSCYSYSSVLERNYNLPENITSLDLARNNLTCLLQPIVSDTLIKLSLFNNKLKEISKDAFYLPSLKILNLSHNDLGFIHRDTFAQIKNLQYLNLANNKLSAFESVNFHHLGLLQEIILDNNNIGPSLEKHGLFEGGFELSNKIESISLINVYLTCNNKNIFEGAHRSLKKLILAQNNITQIPDLPLYLEYLDVSSNPIKNVSRDDFFDVPYLSQLKLNNISIQEVAPYAFHYLTSIRHIELQGNTILKKFSPLTWGGIILKDPFDLLVVNLNLRGSNLTSLDRQLEVVFKKIKRIDLRDNPWNCDCELAWLLHVPIPENLADFRCSTPQNLHNRRVLELNYTEFICEKKKKKDQNIYVTILMYCILLTTALLMMYFFIFSPRPFFYRKLPVEFPQTP